MNNSHDCLFVIIGGANTEQIVELPRQLTPGQKHTAKVDAQSIGGGGLNQSARLRATGHEVEAILPLGDDTKTPEWDRAAGARSYRYAGAKTSHSIISLDERRDRTILNIQGTVEDDFAASLIDRVTDVVGLVAKPYALMLGHIRRDSMMTTSEIIKLAHGAKLRFIFPGRSQFEYCYHSWHDIWPQIDYWQLELSEARGFVQRSVKCKDCQESLRLLETQLLDKLCLASRTASPTVGSILRFFRLTNTTGVVTFNHKGAAAVLRDSETVFVVYPYFIKDLKDPTGAGDAFGAGVASCAMGFVTQAHNPFDPKNFEKVLEYGTLWGALACREYGGASNCPSLHAINTYLHTMTRVHNSVQADIDTVSDFLCVFAD